MLKSAAMPWTETVPSERAVDRRRHRRVHIHLLGRYMLPSREEFPCQVVDMSPGGCHLVAAVRGRVGDRVVVYFETIGRLEGQIARLTERGFAICFAMTQRKREKLAEQLTFLANRHLLNEGDFREAPRIVPRRRLTVVTLSNGHAFPAQIIDLSISGVALNMAASPGIGEAVMIGRTPGTVVRQFPGGCAATFDTTLSVTGPIEDAVL